MANNDRSVMFENARLMFKNFSGKEGKFNRAGDRNFVLFLERDQAEELASKGWNIKQLTPRDDQEDPQAYVQVKVNFGGRPPKIMLITSKGKTPVDEKMVDILDWAELAKVDLIVNPYEWEVSGKSGISLYLKSLYATLQEDDLDRKYADVPDSGTDPAIPDEDEDNFPAPF